MTKKNADDVGEYVDLDFEDYRSPNGTRITERAAEEIAERTVREARARRVGRPSLSGPGTVSPTVNARVSQATKDALRAQAVSRGVPESDLVREAVEEFLAHA